METSKNANPIKMTKQFKLITDDGGHEIIAYERAALKAYYKAKKDLIEAMEDEDSEIESGFVTLMVRNINDDTFKGTEWETYQEYVVEPDPDDDDLGDINEDNVDDDDNND